MIQYSIVEGEKKEFEKELNKKIKDNWELASKLNVATDQFDFIYSVLIQKDVNSK